MKESEFGAVAGAHGGVWECPDFFQLSTPEGKKWVLIININPGAPNGGSGTQYFIGDFDGKNFTNLNAPEQALYVDYGKDVYAGIPYNGLPKEQATLVAWMSQPDSNER